MFKIGDSVRIKNGTRYDDFDLDIGGWQGRVFEDDHTRAHDDVVGIMLDSVTLQGLSEKYIVQAEEEGYVWHTYYEEVANVERADPRDTPEEVDAAYDTLTQRYHWAHLGEEGLDIQKVVGNLEGDSWEAMERWEAHLSEKLTFPFKAVVDDWNDLAHRRGIKGKVRVQKITAIDELRGIIVSIKYKFSRFDFPLCDLAVADQSDPQHDVLDTYRTWYANR